MEMRNANKNIHTTLTPPPSLLFHKKKKETNLLMYLNDIPPQALEIYDFNWFGQAEKFKKRC